MSPYSVSSVTFMLAHLALLSLCMVGRTWSAESSQDSSSTSTSADVQSSTRQKRAPGWGKRSSLEDLLGEQETELVEEIKRAPGWGKRYSGLTASDGMMAEKRAPGWGKRSDEVDVDIEEDKRAPGWGKRAPGWGKRAPGWGKRAPGWGKRAPGWGKRAPGWGKRSGDSISSISLCQTLEEIVDEYKLRADMAEAKLLAQCGYSSSANEPGRK